MSRSCAGSDRSEARSVQEVLQDSLQRTPWWLLSLALHATVLLATFFVVFQTPAPTREVDVVTSLEPVETDPWEEEVPKPEAENDADRELEAVEPALETPVPSDAPEDERNTRDTNDPDEGMKGVPDALSDRPDMGKLWNASIGVGYGGPPGAMGDRFGSNRNRRAREGGGGTATEKAAAAALGWLRRHQDSDGGWSCDAFERRCAKNLCGGKGGSADHSPGVSGLALLAFLGAGNTMRAGPYREVVKRGVRHLLDLQAPDGCLGPRTSDGHFMYTRRGPTTARGSRRPRRTGPPKP